MVGLWITSSYTLKMRSRLGGLTKKLVMDQRGAKKRIVGKDTAGVAAYHLLIGRRGTPGVRGRAAHSGTSFKSYRVPVQGR